MEIGFLHLHKTVVILFLVLLLGKVVLLLAGKKELLQKVRDKTRIADMVLGGLIILTGMYLFFLKSNPGFYLYVKMILVLISIPVGIIGFKKDKPFLAVLSLLIIVYLYGVSETRSATFKPPMYHLSESELNEPDPVKGKVIYENLCVDCHGIDGKKGLFKAPDLTESQLTPEQKLEVIRNGKKSMQPYRKQLDEEEIELVWQYINSLK